jgi:hypothetical protein
VELEVKRVLLPPVFSESWPTSPGSNPQKPYRTAALDDSLAPGWYVRPFQGTELRLKGQNRDQRSSFNTFSTGEIRMLGRSFAVSPSMFLSGLYRIADFVETGMGLSHFARSITDPA